LIYSSILRTWCSVWRG